MPAKRLKQGQSAPEFETNDIQGNPANPRSASEFILLSFFRYASCPLCNLGVRELINRHDELRKNNIKVLAVFQSPREKVLHYVGKQHPPFQIIPDPEKRLYKMYAVESSWLGFFKAWSVGINKVVKAVIGNGFLPGSVENELHRIPADFVIDNNGVLVSVYYGSDIGDHIPIAHLLNLAKSH